MTQCARGCDRVVYCRSLCRPCYRKEPDQRAKSNEYQNKRYALDPAPARVHQAGIYFVHQERIKARVRQYREANRVAVLARETAYNAQNGHVRKAYRIANRDLLRERASDHKRLNRRQYTLNEHRRRAQKVAAGGFFTQEEWLELCERFGNRCPACGEGGSLTIDHIVPIVLGGPSWIWNIQPLCRSCNSAKGRRTTEYRPWRGAPHIVEGSL